MGRVTADGSPATPEHEICLHCGTAVRKDGDWWVDGDDHLTCLGDNLGPHVVAADPPAEAVPGPRRFPYATGVNSPMPDSSRSPEAAAADTSGVGAAMIRRVLDAAERAWTIRSWDAAPTPDAIRRARAELDWLAERRLV